MAKRKKEVRFYNYECSLTGESFKVYAKAEHPDELMSVKAYYELNPEKDDRPADIKKILEVQQAHQTQQAEQEEVTE